jgi:hypothetical protein
LIRFQFSLKFHVVLLCTWLAIPCQPPFRATFSLFPLRNLEAEPSIGWRLQCARHWSSAWGGTETHGLLCCHGQGFLAAFKALGTVPSAELPPTSARLTLMKALPDSGCLGFVAWFFSVEGFTLVQPH